jgi:DNA-binding NarL/FixJ family response regulator
MGKILIIESGNNFTEILTKYFSNIALDKIIHKIVYQEYNEIILGQYDVVFIEYNFLKSGLLKFEDIEGKYLIILVEKEEIEQIKNIVSLPINAIFVIKEEEREITNLFKSIAQNRKFYSHEILSILVDNTFNNNIDKLNKIELLTKKELEILKLLSVGNTVSKIAARLKISENTVKSHKKNIFKKLGFTKSSELILFAVNHKIIS